MNCKQALDLFKQIDDENNKIKAEYNAKIVAARQKYEDAKSRQAFDESQIDLKYNYGNYPDPNDRYSTVWNGQLISCRGQGSGCCGTNDNKTQKCCACGKHVGCSH